MGSDLYMYSREVAIRSHGDLMVTLRRVKEYLERDRAGVDHIEIIKDIERAINNGTIT